MGQRVLLFSRLPQAKELLADTGDDCDWFRHALTSRGITSCIPPTANRKVQHPYDKQLYRQHHKIENLFARLKDWRRIATRYDRCAGYVGVEPLFEQACRRPVGFEMVGTDHKLIGLSALGGELGEDAVLERLVRTLTGRRITPTQAVPDHENDAADATGDHRAGVCRATMEDTAQSGASVPRSTTKAPSPAAPP